MRFILYIDDCRSTHPDCHLVKYADDTVLLFLLSGLLHFHSSVFNEFVEWCDSFFLELNVKKTKKLVVIFSSEQKKVAKTIVTTIHRMIVETVDEFKYMGTILNRNIVSTIYYSFIENITFTVRLLVRKLYALCEQQTLRTACRILQDPLNPMSPALNGYLKVAGFIAQAVGHKGSLFQGLFSSSTLNQLFFYVSPKQSPLNHHDCAHPSINIHPSGCSFHLHPLHKNSTCTLC